MPIPLAQIPNAPQLGPDPAMTSVPNANTNLAGAARTFMTPELRQGSFDGAARGMQSVGDSIAGLGEAGQRVAAVIRDANERKAKFQDRLTIAQVDAEVSEARAQYNGTLKDKTEDQWASGWAKNEDDIFAKAMKDKTLSQEGMQQLAIYRAGFHGETMSDLTTKANGSAIRRGVSERMDFANRLRMDGKYEEAAAKLGELVDEGAIGKDDMTKQLKAWTDERNTNELTGFMQSDAPQFADDMKRIKSGKDVPPHLQEFADHYFSGPDSRIKIDKWEGEAARNLRNVQIQSANEIDDDILSGNITTEDQIHERASGSGLGEKDIRSFVESLTVEKSNTPEGQAKYLDNYDRMWTESVNYDPSSDTDGKERMRILRDIRSQAIPGERQPLLTNLRDAIKDGMTPKRERAANMENTINTLGSQGLLIPKPRNEKDTKAMAEYTISLNEKKAALKKSAREWMRNRPDGEPGADSDWIRQTLGADAADAAASSFGGSGGSWTDWIPHAVPSGMGMGIMFGYPSKPVPSTQIKEKLNSASPPSASNGKIAEPLIDKVKEWEGFSDKAFGDYKQTSIGYGTKAKPGETAISKEAADARLREELATHAKRVDEAARKSGLALNPNQRAALISFDFNTGKGAHLLETSDSVEEIASRIPLYKKVTEDGKLVDNKGLGNRRKKELELFNS